MTLSKFIFSSIALSLLSRKVYAHPHEILSVGATNDPIDGTLWAHIIFMFLAFGIIFPTGVVLGLSKSRWHVPVQLSGAVLVLIGFILGHAHEGREFSGDNVHRTFASTVVFTLTCQVLLGIYLKLHLEKGFNKRFRPLAVKFHQIIGITIPFIGYIQMVFGVITAVGWCRDDHIGQCLAHFIMGSSFIGYGILLIVSLRFGSEWLRSKGKSQDYFDSCMITVWGFINTWTEHRWNSPWTHKDYQHTALGIMWWTGGIVGIYLSRNGKRSIIPGLIIFFTGFAMSAHDQSSEISTRLHANFGYALMGAGLARIVEVCFFAKNDGPVKIFQQLPPYLLILSGLLFMGANEEQIYYLDAEIIDPYSYSLIHVAISFLIFLGVNLLIDLYWRSGKNDGEPKYEKYDKLANNHNIPLPLNNSMTQTGRTVLNTNQDSPTSSNNYEFNSLLVHNNQFDDDDDDNEK
ncbi:integral membrane protein [Rhizophagus clarus]|uniref:Integral membrane protein n=1 Tax=Rhizophagus clarus TaxID=94130 RepID=A0A8H3QHE1_9GLOM|nr:integral membrane protein [Rhizophagus clarus]